MLYRLLIATVFALLASCKTGTTSSSPHSFSYGKDSDGDITTINAEVRLYTKDIPIRQSTIALIDMVHIGSKSYYQRVNAIMEELAKNYKTVVILKEGIRTDKPHICINEIENFEIDFLPKLKQSGADNAIALFKEISTSEVERMIQRQFLKSRTGHCLGEAEERERKSSESDVWDQHLILKFPTQAVVLNRDIQYGDLPLGFQLAIELQRFCSYNLDICTKGTFGIWFEQHKQAVKAIDNYVSVSYRNGVLINSIKTNAEVNDLVVVPWGIDHMPEIYRALENAGFKNSETQRFLYANCNDHGYAQLYCEMAKIDENLKDLYNAIKATDSALTP